MISSPSPYFHDFLSSSQFTISSKIHDSWLLILWICSSWFDSRFQIHHDSRFVHLVRDFQISNRSSSMISIFDSWSIVLRQFTWFDSIFQIHHDSIFVHLVRDFQISNRSSIMISRFDSWSIVLRREFTWFNSRFQIHHNSRFVHPIRDFPISNRSSSMISRFGSWSIVLHRESFEVLQKDERQNKTEAVRIWQK